MSWRKFSRKSVLLAMLALLAVVVIWLVFGGQDPDFQWIGPKTKTIRDVHAWLEFPIEVDNSHDDTTVDDALALLYEKLALRKIEMPVLINHLALKRHGFKDSAGSARLRLRSSVGQLSGRQLLKTVVARFASENAAILVHDQGWLELTTKAEVDLDRAWYQKAFGVTAFDICRQRCAEMLGKEGHLPAAPASGRLMDEAAKAAGF